ncbi:MAG: tryptophan-rich sensory protein [Eubacteriales bacterium]|nr:tryptophan-rich sensory protein [Eubacteriales bacterium]
MKPHSHILIKSITIITFVLMIAANALSNILPLNGVTTGQVSDSYPNLFAPAGFTFSIWGLIYLLLAGYTLYLIRFSPEKAPAFRQELLRKISILFSVSSLANTAWIFSWHYFRIPFSMIFMAVILICLIVINQITADAKLSGRDAWLIRLPFSIYFGWITVATIANATVLLVSLNWDGFGLSEMVWTVIILFVGFLIGTATMLKNRDIAHGLVLIWAYFGIYMKHASTNGFDGRYPSVILSVLICIALFAAAEVFLIVKGRNRH